MDEEKKAIRARIRKLRAQMTREEIGQRSLEIWKRVLESGVYRSCSAVYIYMSLPGEVETRTLIQRAWEDGKKVAVPKTDLEKRQLRFYEIRSFGQVRPGVMGILEPSEVEGARSVPDPDDATLMIVPGVAFDRQRHRIGYGGGFYDRYLELHPLLQTAAAAFDFQILDRVPAGEHDKKPDCIYTPSEVIR
ncbi:MAG: 5-formyltetrahydrofolate cyclo-ligase [Porcincola intestinalis]|jgi:5-formyltetrahydrofolate cyclo-ligase|uniref:5-formyltetrahydrofolate cyclo-ligase n=1 Tax=Porcincola intestinalis TaxID=2606632 RepID=UPI0029D57FBD|nr:5-formyltetrahydrofolate cyclo-ligase [Porcincola intestinalis]MCI6237596.1 5-formyltetrahydrofolate cyclo-ligase [Lachnospiraceae bacterium]MDY5331521.1 5-formyltetrahydrofolate cyclo-ligase [Porcincola intestinalis]